MRLLQTALVDCLRSISKSPLRSSLVILSVSIATFALLTMNTLASSVATKISSDLTELAGDLLIVSSGNVTGPVEESRGQANDVTEDDLAALRRLSQVANSSGVVLRSATASMGGLSYRVVLVGVDSSYPIARRWKLIDGLPLSGIDEENRLPVVVVGEKLANHFCRSQCLGREVMVNGHALRIIGVASGKGLSLEGVELGDSVWVTRAVARKLMGESPNDKSLSFVVVQAVEFSAEAVEAEVRETLSLIRPTQRRSILVTNFAQTIGVAKKVSTSIATAFSAVAGVALVVSIIGVANVMLLISAARFQEMGLRRALGASTLDLIVLFVVEGALLSILGAIVGGVAAVLIMSSLSSVALPLSVPVVHSLAAILVAGVLGGLASLFAVVKAVNISPASVMDS